VIVIEGLVCTLVALVGVLLYLRRAPLGLQPRGFVPLEHRELPPTLWVRKMPTAPGKCAGTVVFGEPDHPLTVPYFNVSPKSGDPAKSCYCQTCAGKYLDEAAPARPWWRPWG
jgi:hypothetical protein